jgi:hypothetical protein
MRATSRSRNGIVIRLNGAISESLPHTQQGRAGEGEEER